MSPAKQVELFKEMLPRLRFVLVLIDPYDAATPAQLTEIRKAASSMKLELLDREATDRAGLEQVFGSIRPGNIDGVVSASNSLHIKFTASHSLASAQRAPLASYRREAVEEGALFSYAPNIAAVGRRAATYAHRILKGTKPGDLPVEQPIKFELVINLRTARDLDLIIPPSVLARADEVIR